MYTELYSVNYISINNEKIYISYFLWGANNSFNKCVALIESQSVSLSHGLTLCNPMNYTIHGILQARTLDWEAFPFSRRSSQPRDWTEVSHIAGRFFTRWVTREAQEYWSGNPIPSPTDLPNPEIEPGSPALRVDSLPTELSGKLL